MKRNSNIYARPETLPKKSKYNFNNVKTPLEPPRFLSKKGDKGNVYYHYTNEVGRQAINNDSALRPSNKNEQGIPCGLCRIYLTDLAPAMMRINSAVVAPQIFGNATFQSWRYKIRYCYVLNLSGIAVEKGAGDHVYYVKNIPFLPIKYMIQGTLVSRVISCINVTSGMAI